jgi:glycosyltransferase involved in cell wall biosynthesis
MAEVLPVVCIFGALNIDLKSPEPIPDFETSGLDCRCFLTDDDLMKVLAEHRPTVIVSLGKEDEFPNLMNAPWGIRRRWINVTSTKDIPKIGEMAFKAYLHNAVNNRNDIPLVTVFTPAFRTGDKIRRPFDSLRVQTHSNWEWVIMDDSDDDGETFEMLTNLAQRDPRIRLYKSYRHSGCIGSLKKDACMLARGEYLVELDHDDELTPFALDKVVSAFKKHPECGFVYTDFAECFEDGAPVAYGQNRTKKPPYSDWGFGYGSYRDEVHGGQKYVVANAPNINPKTIRHIVAAPNHIRSWRKDVYMEMGGHGDTIHVADDYEIMVRTFLSTRMCRVPHMCYVQYRNIQEGNTHRFRIKEIQRLVRYFSQHYDQRIHERFLELGVDDFVWQEGKNTFECMGQIINPAKESHATILFEE